MANPIEAIGGRKPLPRLYDVRISHVNRTFTSLLRLAEMQDILHQFSMLETQTLFGFPHLPFFLHPKIIVSLATDATMKYMLPVLKGFPLLINPMVDVEHTGHRVEASILLTIPEIPNLNAFCTVEYLTPIKYQLARLPRETSF